MTTCKTNSSNFKYENILMFFLNLYFQCVKGLVFSDASRIKLDINAQNERGDTPLHLAAKWGYGKL